MNDSTTDPIINRHLSFGWGGLLFFLSMGIVLEALHGFKVGLYLDVQNETRRHLWTLSHAHGGLIALVQIAFAMTAGLAPSWRGGSRAWASRCLLAALVLVPGGFFLGGAFIHAGDPGLGIFLLPPGGLLLLAGVLLTARGVRARQD